MNSLKTFFKLALITCFIILIIHPLSATTPRFQAPPKNSHIETISPIRNTSFYPKKVKNEPPSPTKTELLISQNGNMSDGTGPTLTESGILPSEPGQNISRADFETSIQTAASIDAALQLFEQYQSAEFGQYFNKRLIGKTPTISQIRQILCQLGRVTGTKPALIYVGSFSEELRILYVVPTQTNNCSLNKEEKEKAGEKIITLTNKNQIKEIVSTWREEISLAPLSQNYGSLESSQKVYNLIIKPLESIFQNNQIDTLVFTMDAGLRSIPLAALHDGKQFLIQKYSLALIPSFGLTDTRYIDVRNLPILAMGASEFEDAISLPAVPVELAKILTPPWRGIALLNEDFTLEKLREVYQKQRFRILHLATHGKFVPGDVSQSFIQLRNEKLRLDQVGEVAEELKWPAPPPVEMLVLSACETALGDQPELGFAGLAVQAGVKSAVASLWQVDDVATLALMSEFYGQLSKTPLKSQALRQTQLAMLQGKVRIENNQLFLSEGKPVNLPPNVAGTEKLDFSHPHYWAGFTLIGNWN
ncbi:CHAT domain-containing protein [Ancylothrix sp. C2]|uniref:CHAT domain-containing protein n=1 Tax=Ancylothrix sp. D3o TaxID=2953691 RepID=UPI0021BA9295|nr:CHAT domain-containing protein [Ancylothrix sp. D3o]MCT7951006.1 CHAT domain-containing protein [Ancylothrix sp. D3o]